MVRTRSTRHECTGNMYGHYVCNRKDDIGTRHLITGKRNNCKVSNIGFNIIFINYPICLYNDFIEHRNYEHWISLHLFDVTGAYLNYLLFSAVVRFNFCTLDKDFNIPGLHIVSISVSNFIFDNGLYGCFDIQVASKFSNQCDYNSFSFSLYSFR